MVRYSAAEGGQEMLVTFRIVSGKRDLDDICCGVRVPLELSVPEVLRIVLLADEERQVWCEGGMGKRKRKRNLNLRAVRPYSLSREPEGLEVSYSLLAKKSGIRSCVFAA